MNKSAAEDKNVKKALSQLKDVAQTIDKKIPELYHHLNERKPFSAPKALARINVMSKDVEKYEVLTKTQHKELQDINKAFQQMNDSGFAFVEKLKSCVKATESYFKQYGYVPPHSTDAQSIKQREEEEDAETKDTESSDDHNNTPEKTKQQKPTTPVQKAPATFDPSRTPKLEGLSEYTMALLNQRAVALRQEVNASTVTKPSATSIPSPFEHNGFLCTPSLFPKFTDRAQSEGHASLASPIHQTIIPEEHEPTDLLADPRSRLGFEGLAHESPKTPDLQTPGLKEMMTSNKKVNVTHNSTRDPAKQSEVKHKASVSLFDPSQYEKQPYTYDDGEPMEPELTYSLETLQEMTGVFKINSQPPQTSKPSTAIHLSNKENTPTEPELLSERLAKLHKETAANPSNNSKPRVLYGDMPPSPKLMMNYDFLNK